MPRDDWTMSLLADQGAYRGEDYPWDEPPPSGPARITVRPANSMYPAREPPPDTLFRPPENEAATGVGRMVFPNLSKPETYGPRPQPALPEQATPEGKLPVADPRIMGGVADIGNFSYNFVNPPSGAAAATAGAGKAIFLAAAKMADKTALAQAQRMAKLGASPDEIWATVKRFQDAGGNWMGEIPDLGSKMRQLDPKDYTTRPLSEHLDQPAVYEAVPRLAKIPTNQISPMVQDFIGKDTLGFVEHTARGPRISYNARRGTGESRSTLIHEGGHAVADFQGLPTGASGSAEVVIGTPIGDLYQNRAREIISDIKSGLRPKMSKDEIDAEARSFAQGQAYYTSAGEAASRAMQTRRDWPLKKLEAESPRVTMEKDVPYADQIVTYRSPLRTDPIVRGRSGRPIQTAPLPIGTEGEILKQGYERATGPRLEEAMRARMEQALAEKDYYHYGLRSHDDPLKVGERAPPSRQWSEGDPVPDETLRGTSTMGLRSAEDIPHALRGAGVVPMDYLEAMKRSPYKHSTYPGENVSLLRSYERSLGNDPGEFILPDAEVVATWKAPPPFTQATVRQGPPSITQSAVRIGDEVHTGPWHLAAYENAAKAMGVPVESLFNPGAEGFVTSTGKFVSREKAMDMAIRARQISSDIREAPWPLNKRLTSEHLALFGTAGLGGMSTLAAQDRYAQ